MLLLADGNTPTDQLLIYGTPVLCFLLGVLPTPRWTVAVPIGATLILAVIAASEGDPDDMPGAGVFFVSAAGVILLGLWLLGRGLLRLGLGARRRKRLGRTGAGPNGG